jgi:hypothetical protein
VDLSFRNPVSVITVAHPEVQFVMVGCGRNGGWLALAIARLMRILQEGGMKVSALISILITEPLWTGLRSIRARGISSRPRNSAPEARMNRAKVPRTCQRCLTTLGWSVQRRAMNVKIRVAPKGYLSVAR